MRKKYYIICQFVAQADPDDTQVTELDPSSYLGYQLKHAALHGAQRYNEAIKVAEIMLFKLDNDLDPETQGKPPNNM